MDLEKFVLFEFYYAHDTEYHHVRIVGTYLYYIAELLDSFDFVFWERVFITFYINIPYHTLFLNHWRLQDNASL